MPDANKTPDFSCYIHNSRTGETSLYKEAIYTKIDGVYGYICVDVFIVKFLYQTDGQMQCDHLAYYTVKYTLSYTLTLNN